MASSPNPAGAFWPSAPAEIGNQGGWRQMRPLSRRAEGRLPPQSQQPTSRGPSPRPSAPPRPALPPCTNSCTWPLVMSITLCIRIFVWSVLFSGQRPRGGIPRRKATCTCTFVSVATLQRATQICIITREPKQIFKPMCGEMEGYIYLKKCGLP